ncbi:hypothetical protein J6590_039122 [Homalodisca vitripennis]|nr:hypothetical protein J6590_039122 [Homalodisca vitripennis]
MSSSPKRCLLCHQRILAICLPVPNYAAFLGFLYTLCSDSQSDIKSWTEIFMRNIVWRELAIVELTYILLCRRSRWWNGHVTVRSLRISELQQVNSEISMVAILAGLIDLISLARRIVPSHLSCNFSMMFNSASGYLSTVFRKWIYFLLKHSWFGLSQSSFVEKTFLAMSDLVLVTFLQYIHSHILEIPIEVNSSCLLGTGSPKSPSAAVLITAAYTCSQNVYLVTSLRSCSDTFDLLGGDHTPLARKMIMTFLGFRLQQVMIVDNWDKDEGNCTLHQVWYNPSQAPSLCALDCGGACVREGYLALNNC